MRRAGVALALLLVLLGGAPALAAPGPPGHLEWWFDDWNVPALWAGGARGQGVVIGEIDTGVNAGLPELSGNVLPGDDFGAEGGNGQVDRDTDEFGHGTAMASLMVASPSPDGITGLAPDARVLPVAVPISGTTDDVGVNGDDHLVDAIRWSADHGARIITMSLGRSHDQGDTGRSCPLDEQKAVDHALAEGAIVVAAGGNSGDAGSPIEDPSVCVGVLSVGAVDQQRQVPVWSSRHPYLTVTAPGVNVPSLGRVGDPYYGDGTSQATALTAAGLALIWSKYPALTGWQVEARLLATLDGAHAGRDPATGFGLIDIGAAVTTAVPATAPNPLQAAAAPFLAQDKALAAITIPAARPATARADFPGAVWIAPPPLLSGQGLAGTVIGAVGLAGVLVLLVTTLRARRRRRMPAP